MVEVTQGDREAAATYMGHDFDSRYAYRSGALDDGVTVQAFARYRIAATADKDARIAELEALLSRMCDAYECICGDTDMRYDLSPSSVYVAARKALTTGDI